MHGKSYTLEQLPMLVWLLYEKVENLEQLIKAQADKSQPSTDRWWTIHEAAAFINLSVDTVYDKVRNREIPFSKKGKRLYFSQLALTEWINSGRQKTADEIEEEAANYCINTKRKGAK